jgi:ferrous iron transport protein A
LKLTELPRRTAATVLGVDDIAPNDAIARRLRELGFVGGERVEVVAAGLFSADPLLVQVGFTRFALRRAEAARIRVSLEAEQGARVDELQEVGQPALRQAEEQAA